MRKRDLRNLIVIFNFVKFLLQQTKFISQRMYSNHEDYEKIKFSVEKILVSA